MNSGTSSPRTSLWVSAWLLLVGQLFYILVTQLHAGGDANNHRAVFAEWTGRSRSSRHGHSCAVIWRNSIHSLRGFFRCSQEICDYQNWAWLLRERVG